MSSKGRIDFQIGVSGAEIREEPTGDVRFCGVPQKLIKNSEKLNIRPIFPKFSERVRTLPNASGRIQTHLNASEQVRAGPSKSENLKKLAKTCEKLAKTSRKNLKKISRSRLYGLYFGTGPKTGTATVAFWKAFCIFFMPAHAINSNKRLREFFFQNCSRSFRKFFASFRKFFEGFGLALTCWDLLGSAWMHSDASGCVRMRPDAFGKNLENLIRKSVFAIFTAFWRI